MTGPSRMASSFTKTNAMYPMTSNYDEKYWKNITMQYPLDTLDNYTLRKSYKETTGGLAFTLSSRTTLMDAPRANNTKSTDPCQPRPYSQLKRKIPAHFH